MCLVTLTVVLLLPGSPGAMQTFIAERNNAVAVGPVVPLGL